MRTECTHCGAAIEFEEDDRGLERACASCGETTMLVEGLHHVASSSPPRSAGARPARFFSGYLVIVVLLGIGCVYLARMNPVQRPAPGPSERKAPSVEDLIEVRDVKRGYFGRTCVEGLVVNHAPIPLARVVVHVNLYDASSNLVENTADSIVNMLPGDRWKFHCLAREDFAHFRLISVRAE